MPICLSLRPRVRVFPFAFSAAFAVASSAWAESQQTGNGETARQAAPPAFNNGELNILRDAAEPDFATGYDLLQPLTDAANKRGISYHTLIDIGGNISVFVPLGATVALAWKSRNTAWWPKALAGSFAGLGLSLTVEILQKLTTSRVSSLSDVGLNTFGAAIGAWGIGLLLTPASR